MAEQYLEVFGGAAAEREEWGFRGAEGEGVSTSMETGFGEEGGADRREVEQVSGLS